MAAAAKALRHPRHIQVALAAQAHAKTTTGKLAKKCRHLNLSNRKHVIHQAFAVFFLRFTAIHLFLRNPGPAYMALGVEVAQSFAEQPHFGDRVGKINAARTVRRIGARQNQLACQSKRILVRSLKHERPSIRHQRGVKAGSNLRRKMRSRFASQAEHHFRRCHGMRIDPVHVGKRPPADMMININQETVFQTLQTGAMNPRHAVVQHHVGLLSHGSQNLAARERRSHGIAIGPRVRRKHEPVALFDLLENIPQHHYAFFKPGFVRDFILFFARASSSSTRAFSRSERSSRKNNSGARLNRNRSTSSCLMYSLAAINPSRLRSASRSSPSTSTRTCADRPSSATCTAVTPTKPMRGSASSPSTSVSISSRKASPNRPRWYLTPRFSTLHLEVKRMRISENRPEMLAPKCYCRAQKSDSGKYRGNNGITSDQTINLRYKYSTNESATSAPWLLAMRVAFRSTFFINPSR